MNFPAELRALRTRAKLTQAELAARVGVTQSRIAEAEGGKRDVLLDTAVKLVEACGAEMTIKAKRA